MTKTAKKKAGTVRPRKLGKETGLSIAGFLALCFESNELLADKKKQTDEQLLARVMAEFPGYEAEKYGIPKHRGYYNRGRYTNGIPPAVPSFRYAKNGVKVDFRTGRRELLPEEVTIFLAQHQKFRDATVKSLLKKRSA